MRKLSICISLVVVAAISILLLAISAEPVQACYAVMGPQDCSIVTASGNYYVGSGTEVKTPSGQWKFTCNASWISGPGVENTARGTLFCDGLLADGPGEYVENPGGRAHAFCHN